MATAQQDATGQWKLTIRHDKSDIVFPATFTYNNIPVSFNITSTDQTIENTGWFTTLGEPIDLGSINMVFTPVKKDGKTYIVSDTEFDVIPYESGGQPRISISLSPTSVDAEGGNNVATLTVRSNTGWTITNTADFITLSTTTGSGDTVIQVNVSEYTGTSSDRAATLTGQTTGDNQKTSTATLTQKKATGEESKIAVAVLPNTISYSGGTGVTLHVSSNTSWTIARSASFATLSQSAGTGDAHIDVSVNAYSDINAPRSVVFSGITTDGKKVSTTTLIQTKAPSPFTNFLNFKPKSKTFSSGATTFTLEVSSNTSWTITVNPNVSWISLTKSGSGNRNLTVSVTANDSGQAREAGLEGYIGSQFQASATCYIKQLG